MSTSQPARASDWLDSDSDAPLPAEDASPLIEAQRLLNAIDEFRNREAVAKDDLLGRQAIEWILAIATEAWERLVGTGLAPEVTNALAEHRRTVRRYLTHLE